MTDQELIAKTVFGEITLGEVLKKFADRISSIEVESNGLDSQYESWLLKDGELRLFGEYEMELALPLDSKVKVQEDSIEVRHKDETYSLTFVESNVIKFDSLLPRALISGQ
jgi:hypothetical protein